LTRPHKPRHLQRRTSAADPHPAPTSRTRCSNVPADPPVGAFDGIARRRTRHHLPDDAGILLYTDGLVERRGQPVTDSIEQLRTVLSGANAAQMCLAAMTAIL
jgi:phosphoserine phosphatase RsbU/P